MIQAAIDTLQDALIHVLQEENMDEVMILQDKYRDDPEGFAEAVKQYVAIVVLSEVNFRHVSREATILF